MKAAILENFGDGQQFSITDVEEPGTPPGHVLIRVKAVSVNPADVKIRAHGGALAPSLPAILGMDVAGEVVEVGDGVEGFPPGSRVYGCVGGVGNLQGTLAEFVSADARLLAKMPSNLSFRQAAALPLVSITAWEGLVDRVRLEAGTRVLVYGGTGGVGHVAIQLAKSIGAQVTAVVSSTEKATIASSLGADDVAIRTSADFEDHLDTLTEGRGFDVVFDTVGGDNLNHAIKQVGLNGQVVTLVTRQSYDLSAAMTKALSIHIVFMLVPLIHNLQRERHGAILEKIAELVAQGSVMPLLDRHFFNMESTTRAFDRVADGEAIGKVVVEVGA